MSVFNTLIHSTVKLFRGHSHDNMNTAKTEGTLAVFWKLSFPNCDKDVYSSSTYFIPAF